MSDHTTMAAALAAASSSPSITHPQQKQYHQQRKQAAVATEGMMPIPGDRGLVTTPIGRVRQNGAGR